LHNILIRKIFSYCSYLLP